MRYMKKKIHFNKSELKELERRNPTLFELAQYFADNAHITAIVVKDNWIVVAKGDGREYSDYSEYPEYSELLCPSSVFYVPGTNLSSGDPECSEFSCWSMHDEYSETSGKTYRPCWFRRWNDFVANMKSDCEED